jgi:single-stranded-DNA-specific exonuclease
MLERFGGHPMAAGLSIEPARIPEFRRALSRTVRAMCGAGVREPPLQIDGYIPLTDLSLDLVAQLERLAPFGPGNPALTLASRDLSVKSHAAVGRTGEHLRLVVEDGSGAVQTVLWWQGDAARLPAGRFDLAYTVRASDYRGRRDVQVEWVDARLAEPPAPLAAVRLKPPAIRVVDCRQEADPYGALERLRADVGGDVPVWAEAEALSEVGGRDRRSLELSESLVIWTLPPGPAELSAALKTVAPRTVYLFGVDPVSDSPGLEVFLKRLVGLVKHRMSAHGGRASVLSLTHLTLPTNREV